MLLNGPKMVVRDPEKMNVSTVAKKVRLEETTSLQLLNRLIGHWARDCQDAPPRDRDSGGRGGFRGGRGGGRGGFNGRDRSPRRGNDRDRRYSLVNHHHNLEFTRSVPVLWCVCV